MAGANYMGGKRNLAKARTRDATGRIQKGHFGRQRLQNLAKALAAPTNSFSQSRAGQGRVGLSDIQLVHAHRDKLGSDMSVNQDSIYASSTTPNCVKGPPTDNSTSSSRSDHSRASKVLRALDTAEPISMRAEIDRLLSLSDFAGLSMKKEVTDASSSPSTKRKRSADWEELDCSKRVCLPVATSVMTPVKINARHCYEASFHETAASTKTQSNTLNGSLSSVSSEYDFFLRSPCATSASRSEPRLLPAKMPSSSLGASAANSNLISVKGGLKGAASPDVLGISGREDYLDSKYLYDPELSRAVTNNTCADSPSWPLSSSSCSLSNSVHDEDIYLRCESPASSCDSFLPLSLSSSLPVGAHADRLTLGSMSLGFSGDYLSGLTVSSDVSSPIPAYVSSPALEAEEESLPRSSLSFSSQVLQIPGPPPYRDNEVKRAMSDSTSSTRSPLSVPSPTLEGVFSLPYGLSDTSLACRNILDEADPWDFIGTLLNLSPSSRRASPSSELLKSSVCDCSRPAMGLSRHGVGFSCLNNKSHLSPNQLMSCSTVITAEDADLPQERGLSHGHPSQTLLRPGCPRYSGNPQPPGTVNQADISGPSVNPLTVQPPVLALSDSHCSQESFELPEDMQIYDDGSPSDDDPVASCDHQQRSPTNEPFRPVGCVSSSGESPLYIFEGPCLFFAPSDDSDG